MTFKPVFVNTATPVPGGQSTEVSQSPVALEQAVVQAAVDQAMGQYQSELEQCQIDTQVLRTTLVSQLSQMDVYSPNGVATLGDASAQKISSYSDDMLKHVKCKDLEHMAGNLTEVIGLAKGVNIEALVGDNNFFSKLISKVKNTKEKILAQFNSVNTQLERLVKEIDKQQSSLRERAHQLDNVFIHNMNEYKELSSCIVFGEAKLNLIQQKIDGMAEEAASSSFLAQQVSDLKDIAARVEKRVYDLKSLQMLALQTAPMIRMVQTNNLTLVEKFDNIKTLTIPAWKKQFTLAISMLEQKKAVQLSNKIDDTTNDLIRKNADMLRQNTLDVARSNQRSVVDIETLEHVQTTLISTLQDVVTIEQEGARQRQAASQKMESMKTELLSVLSN